MKNDKNKSSPPLSPEQYEQRLIGLTMRQAEMELEQAKASSQVMTHFLKLATERARAEVEKLKTENLLLQEKIRSEKANRETGQLFQEALRAFRTYTISGIESDDMTDHEDYEET